MYNLKTDNKGNQYLFKEEVVLEECFECLKELKKEELELHHVIPKSLGGTRIVPLCPECHDRAHDIQGGRKTSASILSKQALVAVRESRALGSPDKLQWGWRNIDGRKVAHQEEQAIGKLIQSERSKGSKLKQIQKILQEKNMKTRKGTDFTIPGISRLARTFVEAEQPE